MNSEENITAFDRKKIYEKLDYLPKPEGYNGKLPWIIQQQVAATNGIQYVDRVGKLKDYPLYNLPVEKVNGGLMLDIGTGWGRWLIAGANKGYLPIGVDVRLEFCETSLQTLKALGKNGYTLVGDLKHLPFKTGIFDLVWSFSVIQHTHKDRLTSCLEHIKRILSGKGFTMLQFPNKYGVRNYFGPFKINRAEADNYNSWVVRYYSVKEYKKIFLDIFKNFHIKIHSALGIGVLKEDLKYVSFKNKILCSISLLLTNLFRVIPPCRKISDSIYIKAYNKDGIINQNAVNIFMEAHKNDPDNNLNIIHLLQCPATGLDLKVSDDKKTVITVDGSLQYPVVNNIPILIKSEAVTSK